MGETKTLEVLFPGPKRPLFCAMFAEANRWWSLAELAGRAGVQQKSVRQHVVQLRNSGLVREKTEGGRQWFQPDPACPVFEEMQGIVTKLTAARGGETILIVEDQEATAQITRILLESWGYQVLETHSAAEALEIFSKDGDAVQLVLTDVIMPGVGGQDLARELRAKRPGLRIVFMSGYPNERVDDAGAAFLPKPFNPASLSRMIRKELDRPAAVSRRGMKGS